MLTAFTLSLAVAIFSSECVYAEHKNETSQNENDNDFADSSPAVAGNFTASFSVSDSGDVEGKILNFGGEKLDTNASITDRNGNEEPLLSNQNAVEFNTLKSPTNESKKLEDFRPSPQLDTYYEYNKFPVKPVLSEPKMVKNYVSANSQESELPPLGTDRQTSRNLNNFEPGYSAFGNFRGSGRPENGLSRNSGGTNYNNKNNIEGPPWTTQTGVDPDNRKSENGNTAWASSRVRFPQKPNPNESPYAFVSNPGTNQNPHYPQSNTYNNNNAASPPNNNAYLPPTGGRFSPLNMPDTSKNNYNNVNINKVGYASPTSSYLYTGGGNSNSYPNYGPSSGTNVEEFNFNKLVEVPQSYYPEPPSSPHHVSYGPSYNLMERPSSEGHHKTHEGGMSNPWKKILKLFATFIPLGLLISALTPTVITVTNINDTSNMATTRYRSSDNPRKELKNHLVSSLDYFEKLNENGCEYRVFCELLVSASHMPNSKQHVENLLDNFAKEEIDYKSRANELRKVFAAVRSRDCNSIPCEFIKTPT